MPVIISAYIFWGVMWNTWLTQWALAASPPPYYGSPYAFEYADADAAARAIDRNNVRINRKMLRRRNECVGAVGKLSDVTTNPRYHTYYQWCMDHPHGDDK